MDQSGLYTKHGVLDDNKGIGMVKIQLPQHWQQPCPIFPQIRPTDLPTDESSSRSHPCHAMAYSTLLCYYIILDLTVLLY